MTRGDSYHHITLLDEAEQIIDLPFVELAQELWDEKQQRLTVLLDPGRIKRGLKPNEDVGPPLVAGKKYTLVIAKDWQDAERQSLAQEYRKELAVGSFDATQPDPSSWRISAPQQDSRESLAVTFAEPLDHALSSTVLQCFNLMVPRLWATSHSLKMRRSGSLLHINLGNTVGMYFELIRDSRTSPATASNARLKSLMLSQRPQYRHLSNERLISSECVRS